MKIWKRIRSLSLYQLYKFSMLFLRHPRLITSTINATKETFFICNRFYEEGHGISNRGNAFRHAVWNILICEKSFKKTKNRQKSVDWAQKVTDLYEKVTQNSKLDEQMDLHNNAVGRNLFLSLLEEDKDKIIQIVYKKSLKAVKMISVKDLENLKQDMVYLID